MFRERILIERVVNSTCIQIFIVAKLILQANVIPMGKPRMTQRDRWAKRKCVLKYYEFKDKIREEILKSLPEEVDNLSWIAFIPMPKSWTKKKKAAHAGQPHLQKPDRDNIDKAIMDSLFKEDSGIYRGTIEKRWEDNLGPRIMLIIETKDNESE